VFANCTGVLKLKVTWAAAGSNVSEQIKKHFAKASAEWRPMSTNTYFIVVSLFDKISLFALMSLL
jgi:hypothetical protein